MSKRHSAPKASAIEWALVVIGYVIFSTRILRLLTADSLDKDPFAEKVIFFAFYAIVVLAAAANPRRLIEGLRAVPGLAALHGLAILSLVWSIDPGASLNRVTALIGSSLFGLYIATFVPRARVLDLFATGTLLTAVLSFALIFFVPSLGLDSSGPWVGAWVGAYGHKNALGEMAGLSALISFLALQTTTRGRLIPLSSFGLNLVLLAASKSLTGQLTFACCMLLTVVPFRAIHATFRLIPIGIVCLGAIALVLGSAVSAENLASLLEGFGKDMSLSGRLKIWESVEPFVRENFWLGSGYEAFWSQASDPARVIAQRLHFRPFYAHNGILELWLGLGFVGVAIFLAVFGNYIVNIFTMLLRRSHDAYLRLGLVLIVIFFLENTSESVILVRNHIVWVMFVMFDVWLADALAGHRMRQSVAPGPALSPATALTG